MKNNKLPWRWIGLFHRLLYRIGLAPLIGRLVLLLTSTGRKSGQPHITPLMYDEMDELFYVASARGQRADWFRNTLANPNVEVQVGYRHFSAVVETITDPVRIADFLALRLQRRPRIVGTIMQLAGLPKNPSLEQLKAYAVNRAMAVIKPIAEG